MALKKKRESIILSAPSKVAMAAFIDKEGVAAAHIKYGLPLYKLQHFSLQVKYRAAQAKICAAYQPFTSNASKRRARQVGA